MQRVAIARATFQKPAFYLADEPVSNLDPKNSKAIMKILARLAEKTPVLGVFHQPDLISKYCTRVIAIKDGEIAYNGDPKIAPRQLADIYGDELQELEHQPDVDDISDADQDLKRMAPVTG